MKIVCGYGMETTKDCELARRERKSQRVALTNSELDVRESTNLTSNRDLWIRLRRSLDSRVRFVESHLSKNLAFQIRTMRDHKDWSQAQLASAVGMNQNAVSRIENPYYGKTTLSTLKRIASAFDVALVVRFVPYSELVHWVTGTLHQNKGL